MNIENGKNKILKRYTYYYMNNMLTCHKIDTQKFYSSNPYILEIERY